MKTLAELIWRYNYNKQPILWNEHSRKGIVYSYKYCAFVYCNKDGKVLEDIHWNMPFEVIRPSKELLQSEGWVELDV